jgi:deoxyribonuclease IV
MGAIRFGPAHVPSREDPAAAIDALMAGGYTACEINFGRGFWMEYDFAQELSEMAREAGIALSLHAPLPAFLGHADRGKKYRMAIGMLDHSAGIAKAAGAEPVVLHPGYLLGRDHAASIAAVVEQMGSLRERLEAKDRAVPFGVEVMGRVTEFGNIDDVVAIASQLDWVRPVIDFAHMHATSDGAFMTVVPFHEALTKADAVIEPGAPFHIHFSDIAYANRNENRHLPYGEGTLRAEPMAEALGELDRPATVIGESPDDASNQAIQSVLAAYLSPR